MEVEEEQNNDEINNEIDLRNKDEKNEHKKIKKKIYLH